MTYASNEIVNNWMKPDFKFFINRKGNRREFLLENDNLKGEYLGSCLDYIRWGGQTTVMYELGTKGLINFIQQWMDLNKNNLIWSDEKDSENFTLPYIKHDKCPRDEKHKGIIRDLAGRVRCSYQSEKKLKPSFVRSFSYFDKNRQVHVTDYWEDAPRDTLPDDAWDENTGELLDFYKEDLEKYQEQMEKFEEEEPTFIVKDFCYAILSDEKVVLSLEEVLDRLNLVSKTKTVYCSGTECKRLDELPEDNWFYEGGVCPGHIEENDETVHPFSGWELARYVQRWHEQITNNGAPVFEK